MMYVLFKKLYFFGLRQYLDLLNLLNQQEKIQDPFYFHLFDFVVIGLYIEHFEVVENTEVAEVIDINDFVELFDIVVVVHESFGSDKEELL